MGIKPVESFDSATRHVKTKGLHWLMAVVFVIGDEAGGGMIALPNAIVSAGLVPGLFLLVLSAIFTLYTGYQLAENFSMMTERWTKYHSVCRKPYGEMAFRAYGPRMRQFVAFMLCATQFGFASVLVLLGAKNVGIALDYFFAVKVHKCLLIVVIGFVVWPATMLRSPAHFWQLAVFSAASSSIAVVLLTIGMNHDASVCSKEVAYSEFSLTKFSMAFGTIVFAFGGHAVFPTIQHDMQRPYLFKRSVFVAYIFIVTYYMLQSMLGYFIYGNSIGEASIQSVQLAWVQQSVNLMIALHVITTLVIVFSPMTQQIEELLKISHSFGWQRVVVRSLLFWLILFTCLSLPHFGPFLDLIGASTMATTTLILPPLFYLSLQASWNKRKDLITSGRISTDSEDNEIPSISDILHYNSKPALIFNGITLAFGIIGGLLATVTSTMQLFSSELGSPCYVDYFRGTLALTDTGLGGVNCCGAFRNITVSGISPTGYCSLEPRLT